MSQFRAPRHRRGRHTHTHSIPKWCFTSEKRYKFISSQLSIVVKHEAASFADIFFVLRVQRKSETSFIKCRCLCALIALFAHRARYEFFPLQLNQRFTILFWEIFQIFMCQMNIKENRAAMTICLLGRKAWSSRFITEKTANVLWATANVNAISICQRLL